MVMRDCKQNQLLRSQNAAAFRKGFCDTHFTMEKKKSNLNFRIEHGTFGHGNI
jgi:hypothetical protein